MRNARAALAVLGAAAAIAGASWPAAASTPRIPGPGQPPAHTARIDSATIGVVPFAVDPRDTLLAPLAFGLPDLLMTDLSRSRQLTLVERSRLATILRELDLARAPGVSQAGAPRVGRMLQARRLVTGSLRRVNENTILFEARINDVETGRVTQALSATAPLNDLLAAEKQVAFRLFTALGVVLTPQERALVEQTPTRNLAALLAYGQGVQAEVNGQYALAMRRYRAAGRLDPGFRGASERGRLAAARLPNLSIGHALEFVNRRLLSIPKTLTPGFATDPAYPASAAAPATVIINVSRP